MSLIQFGTGAILIALAFILFMFGLLVAIVLVREIKEWKRDR